MPSPSFPFIVNGRVSSIQGEENKARVTFTSPSSGLSGTVVTNGVGEYVFDLSNISYVDDETVSVNTVSEFKDKVNTSSVVASGTNAVLNIFLKSLVEEVSVGGGRHVSILHNAGGLPHTYGNPLPVTDLNVGSEILCENYVNEYLVTSAGSTDMGVDGSGDPVSFSYTVPTRKKLLLGRMLIFMQSGSVFSSDKFMHLAALTNGVSIQCNGGLLTNWKDNIDVVTDMFDSEAGKAFSVEGKVLRNRWTFYKARGGMKGLVVDGNESVKAIIQDDLSAAGIIFRIKIQGVLIDDK